LRQGTNMLSKQAIEEFCEIYSQTYGRDLSYEEAAEQASHLLRLYKAMVGGGKLYSRPYIEEGVSKNKNGK